MEAGRGVRGWVWVEFAKPKPKPNRVLQFG